LKVNTGIAKTNVLRQPVVSFMIMIVETLCVFIFSIEYGAIVFHTAVEIRILQ